MAIERLSAQIVGSDRSTVAMAAYRHRTRMFDATKGVFTKLYDKGREDLVHAEISLPENSPEWAIELVSTARVERASQNLWSLVQESETRINGQLAREIQLALPIELTQEENIALVRRFVSKHITAKKMIADWVYHDNEGNPHVHIMHTLKPVEENGFGRKLSPVIAEDGTPLRVNGKLIYRSLIGGKADLKDMRLAWGEMASEALSQAGHDIRVDMRSYADRGIDLPSLDVTMAARDMAMAGRKSDEWIAKERARFEAADKLADDPSAVIKLVASQQSTFTEKDLAKAVHRYVDDPVQFQNIMSKVLAHPHVSVVRGRIVDPASQSVLTEPVYATREMVRTEYEMGVRAERLAAAKGHGIAAEIVDAAIRSVETKDASRPFSFDREQVEAVRHVTRDNGIAAIVGFAGAGKSTLMEAANAAWLAEGRRVFGAALSGKAAEGLEESAGISSRTLASWELSWKNGRDVLGKGDVFVIDEAGMVSSGQLARFVRAVEAAGAKLVLVGDAMQLQPIEAGAAFRAVADKIGYLELAGIRRQKESWAQDASRAFARGHVADALQAYQDRGYIKVETDKDAVISRMVADWMAARAGIAAGDGTAGRDIATASNELLMLAHSNADVAVLNSAIRAALKESGALADEWSFVTARGTRQFAVEDRIVFLENKVFTDPSAEELGRQRVKNGMTGTVIGIEQSRDDRTLLRVRLDNGREVAFCAATYNNVDHGYAATVHKSQGVTVDRTFVLASGGMDQHLTYVAMSRHRHQVDLYVSASEFSSALTRSEAGEVQVNHGQGVTGTLVEAGSALFREDSDEAPTPYADIKTADGKLRRLWGVAIPDALEKAGVVPGDTITLKRNGTETVIKNLGVTDEQTGARTQEMREVQRNVWEATLVETARDAEARIARGETLAVHQDADSEALASEIASGVFDALVARLSRSGAKSTTLDYAESADYRQIVDGFAARRGIDTFASIFPALTASVEKHRQRLVASFGRVANLWRREGDTARNFTNATAAEAIKFPSASPEEAPVVSGALLPLTAFATGPEEAAVVRLEQSAAWGAKLDAMQSLINRMYLDPASARAVLSRAAAIGTAVHGGENNPDTRPQAGAGFDPRALAQLVAQEPERFGNIRHGNPVAVQAAARDLAVHVRTLAVRANQTRDKALATEGRHREAAAHAIPQLSENIMRRLAEIEAVRVAGGKEGWAQAARYTLKNVELITEVKALDAALTARFGWQAFSDKEDEKSRAVTQTRLSHADRIILSAPAISTFVTEATVANALGRADEELPARKDGSLTLEETWRAARRLASFNHFVEQRAAKQASENPGDQPGAQAVEQTVVAQEAVQVAVSLPAQSVAAAPSPKVETASPESSTPVLASVAEGDIRPIENMAGIRAEKPLQAPTAAAAVKVEHKVEPAPQIEPSLEMERRLPEESWRRVERPPEEDLPLEIPQVHTRAVAQQISAESAIPGAMPTSVDAAVPAETVSPPVPEAALVSDIAQRTGPLVPSVTLPDLNLNEIRATVLQDPHIIDIGARVDRSAEIIYGNASVMQSFKAQALQSRDAAVSAHNTIKADPEQIAPLTGTPASFWRKASPERVEAERNVYDLANTVARYGNDYHYEIEKIQEEHRQEQSRQRVEIPAPSPCLAEMLSLKSEEQAAAMVTAPELKAELSHLIEAMRQRLTHVEHRALNEGKMQVVAKALHIDEEAAQRLSSVYSQVNQAEAVVRQQRRLEQSKGLGLSI